MTTTDRTEYTKGLRALADVLDANPDIPLPYYGSEIEIGIGIHGTHVPEGCEVPEMFASVARRVIPGTRNKRVDADYYRVSGQLHGLKLQVWGMRSQVCERVVTGTREVTREVPDPDALAAVPTTTVTETVEDVEWLCAPLLAEPVTA